MNTRGKYGHSRRTIASSPWLSWPYQPYQPQHFIGAEGDAPSGGPQPVTMSVGRAILLGGALYVGWSVAEGVFKFLGSPSEAVQKIKSAFAAAKPR